MYNLQVEDYDRYVYENELKDFLPKDFIDFHVHAFRNDYEPYFPTKVKSGQTWVGMIADEMRAEQLNDTYKQLFPQTM